MTQISITLVIIISFFLLFAFIAGGLLYINYQNEKKGISNANTSSEIISYQQYPYSYTYPYTYTNDVVYYTDYPNYPNYPYWGGGRRFPYWGGRFRPHRPFRPIRPVRF